MADFKNRPLSVIARIYQFAGGPTVRSDFDVSSSIQPVHDVSREAELGTRGRAQAGFLELGQTFVHVGVGTLRAATDVYASFNSISDFSDFDSQGASKDRLWLLGLFGTTSDDGDFGICATALLYQTPLRTYLLARWALTSEDIEAGGRFPLVHTDPRAVPEPDFPIFFPPGALWGTRSTADNAGTTTTRIFSRWWAGPLGVTPPGLR